MIAAHLPVQRADREAVCLQQPDQGVSSSGTGRVPARRPGARRASPSAAPVPREGRVPRRGCPQAAHRHGHASGGAAGASPGCGRPPNQRPCSRRNRRTWVRRFPERWFIKTWATRVGCTPLAPRRIVCRKSSPLRMRWTAREQRLRQTAWRGPCGGGPRGSRGRRGCACGGGSRASWHDDGCSAGKYACSRCVPHGSQSGPVDGHRSPTTEKCGCRGHAAEVVQDD